MKKASMSWTLVLSAFALLTLSSAHAASRAECAAVKPSADELKQIQAAFLDSEKESIPLESDLRLARLNEKALLEASDTTLDAAQAASAATADAKAKVDAVKEKLRNTILYTIVAPENRVLVARCFQLGQEDSRARRAPPRRSRGERRGRGNRSGGGVDLPTNPPTASAPSPTAPDPTTADDPVAETGNEADAN